MWTQIFFCILSFMMLVGKGKVSNKSSLGETYVGEKYPSLELGKKDFLRVAEGDLGNWGTVETGERSPGQKTWGGVWRIPQGGCGAEPMSPRMAGPGEERFLGSQHWFSDGRTPHWSRMRGQAIEDVPMCSRGQGSGGGEPPEALGHRRERRGDQAWAGAVQQGADVMGGHLVLMGVSECEGSEGKRRRRRRLWPEQDMVISQAQPAGKVQAGQAGSGSAQGDMLSLCLDEMPDCSQNPRLAPPSPRPLAVCTGAPLNTHSAQAATIPALISLLTQLLPPLACDPC